MAAFMSQPFWLGKKKPTSPKTGRAKWRLLYRVCWVDVLPDSHNNYN